MSYYFRTSTIFLFIGIIFFTAAYAQESEDLNNLALDEAIQIALENHGLIKSGELEVKKAETQYGQASSGKYPSLNLNSSLIYLDENPNYIFPSFDFNLDGLELPIIGSLDIPPLTVPQQNIKLLDKFNIESTLKLVYPIFTGGKISSLIAQTESNIKVAQNKLALVKEELIYNVSKAYWGCVLLNKLNDLGEEALARLEATLELTENLYRKGSGSVTKLDYLKNKMIVESARGLVESIKGQQAVAYEALKFLVGIEPAGHLSVKDNLLNPIMLNDSLYVLSEKLLQQNSQIKLVENALQIFSAKIDEASSTLYPNIAVFGFYKNQINSYEAGYATKQNKNQFGAGVGLELPIFEGLRSAYKIDETEIEYQKLQNEKTLLTQSLKMNLSSLHAKLMHSQKRLAALNEAMVSAIDNRDLTKRAYHNDMAPIEDYIQSQLMESIMKAQYYLGQFEVVELNLQLRKLIGE